MRSIYLAAAAAALLVAFSGVASAQRLSEATITGSFRNDPDSQGGRISAISANTDAGRGNGGELVVLIDTSPDSSFVINDIGEEGDANINAFDPIEYGPITIATDPGNSGGGGGRGRGGRGEP
jgi:hypothetical protein